MRKSRGRTCELNLYNSVFWPVARCRLCAKKSRSLYCYSRLSFYVSEFLNLVWGSNCTFHKKKDLQDFCTTRNSGTTEAELQIRKQIVPFQKLNGSVPTEEGPGDVA